MTQHTIEDRSRITLWLGAFTGFYRPAADEVRRLDPVSKFLYAARSIILVISAQAALIAGLFALADRKFDILAFALVLVGLVVAHMVSNLSNDWVGWKRGHDTPDSPRMRYTVHPLAGGTIEPRVIVGGLIVLAIIGLSICAWFIAQRGWTAAGFAAAGIALMWWYDAAPVPLKSIGLGEVATLIVWGPLMIGGSHAMITGTVSADVMWASVPYGLGVMTILVGKHIDQMEFDTGKDIRTLPVVLGEARARSLNVVLLGAMYAVILVLVALGHLTPFALAVLAAAPLGARAMATLRAPRPASAPAGYVGWPLWFHRACLVHNRRFGWLYIAGLAAGAAWPGVRF